MANKKIQVDVNADVSKFQRGMGQASQSSSTFERVLKRLGPVGQVAQGLIDKIGLSSLTSAAGIAGGITAALGVSTAIAEKAINQYITLGEQIRNYSKISGQSAEDSSRQVQAFTQLGVSEDLAAAAMFHLGREAGSGGDKLRKVGVELAKNNDGTVDLNATLLNVIQAYHSTGDAAQRDAIIFAAFGKAGATMLPILEANVEELKRLEAQVGKVYTEKDLQAIRNYKLAQQELKRNQDELGLSIGQALLPAQRAVINTANEEFYVHKRLAEAYDNGTLKANAQGRAISNLEGKFRDEYRAAQDAQHQTDLLADSQRLAADAAKREADAENVLFDSIHKNVSAAFAGSQARITLANAIKAANDAKGKDNELNLREREAYVAVADAAVAMAEAQAEVNGEMLSASQKADVWRSNLNALIVTLDPKSQLRKDLEGYLNQLHAIPSAIGTVVTLTGAARPGTHAGGKGLQTLDDGGVVAGPPGAAVPVIAHGGELVLNADQQKALGNRRTFQTTININGAQDPHAISREVARALRRLTSV